MPRVYLELKHIDWINPETKKKEPLKIWLDGILKTCLDTIVYNVKYTKKGKWDCMVIISGNRMVRTGKSTFAQLISAYMAEHLGVEYNVSSVYFESQELMDDAIKKPAYSIIHYDESRRGLVATKRMSRVQEDLMDYFTECGQLHQVIILVLPDFFSLNEEIAVARSECLFNVYRGETSKLIDLYGTGQKVPVVEWDRGRFSFFNRKQKAYLYDCFKRTRTKSYFSTKAINGFFKDFQVLNQKEYEEKKLTALKKYQKNKKERFEESKTSVIRDRIIYEYFKLEMTHEEIAKLLEQKYGYKISRVHVTRIVNKMKEKEETP